MKEIYRSFNVLTVDNVSGIVVYQGDGFYQIEEISLNKPTRRFRVSEEIDWTDSAEVGKAKAEIFAGTREGQVHYKGRWYKTATIHSIQKSYEDYEWRKYV